MVTWESVVAMGCEYTSTGIIVAELPIEGILNAAVSVLWASGEFVERVPHRILKVISAELTDDQLEMVAGGMSPERYEAWRCEMLNESR